MASRRRSVLVLAALAAGVMLAGCGSEQEVGTETSTVTVSENPSAPTVAGPSPAPAPTRTDDLDDDDRECGTVAGPDGALRVVITDGDVGCGEVLAVAEKYSPLIATGQDQLIDGWDCGPSDDDGELAECERDDDGANNDDDDEFSLLP